MTFGTIPVVREKRLITHNIVAGWAMIHDMAIKQRFKGKPVNNGKPMNNLPEANQVNSAS